LICLRSEVAVASLFDGSAETQIAITNLGASKAFSIAESGIITKVCLIFTPGVITAAEAGTVFLFDTDPVITIETADMTVAEAKTVVGKFAFVAGDYETDFTASKLACLDNLTSPFHSISHAVYHNGGATTLTNEDIDIHLWYRR